MPHLGVAYLGVARPSSPYLSAMLKACLLISFLTITGYIPSIYSQIIELSNPSFEDTPADATTPQGWMPCSEGSTPDILPGYWGVYSPSSDGQTYVGLITRHNGTWETIGQRLPATLEKGVCYDWYLDLAHSDVYSGYDRPIRLRVWISSLKCQKDQMIYESPLIEHLDWKTYRIKFTPKEDYRYILLEAYYSDKPFSYQGNILIDRLREIRVCDRT